LNVLVACAAAKPDVVRTTHAASQIVWERRRCNSLMGHLIIAAVIGMTVQIPAVMNGRDATPKWKSGKVEKWKK
jgi:hypothetical protein